MSTFKPMLACAELPPLDRISYPVYVTPKIDGVRAMKVDGDLLSRSLKMHTNNFICDTLADLPDGLDGELIVRNAEFNDMSGAIRRESGEPDFAFLVFDCFLHPDKPYLERAQEALELVAKFNNSRVRFLPPAKIETPEALKECYLNALARGFEGLIIRSAEGGYKYGRATQKSEWMTKYKPFEDNEATVIDFYELMHNGNEAKKNELGRTARSSTASGLVGGDTLGGLVLRTAEGVEFRCGTGFDDAQRAHIWAHRTEYMGELAKYKSMTVGVKDKPRHPVFLGWRDPKDL
jgi:DNA ligase-1